VLLNLLQSIIATFIVVWRQISSSGHIEALTKTWVKVPALKHKYQVVCNNAAPDESDRPFVVLGQGDLNSEFTEGLKAAFE